MSLTIDRLYPDCTVTEANVLAEATNEELGVRAEVFVSNDIFKVRVIDTDANLQFPCAETFTDLEAAKAYVKTCV